MHVLAERSREGGGEASRTCTVCVRLRRLFSSLWKQLVA